MRVTMLAKVNGDNQLTDADYYSPRAAHRISVASRAFSSKVVVHRVKGYYDEDVPESQTVFPTFAHFLMEFTDYDEIKSANLGDI